MRRTPKNDENSGTQPELNSISPSIVPDSNRTRRGITSEPSGDWTGSPDSSIRTSTNEPKRLVAVSRNREMSSSVRPTEGSKRALTAASSASKTAVMVWFGDSMTNLMVSTRKTHAKTTPPTHRMVTRRETSNPEMATPRPRRRPGPVTAMPTAPSTSPTRAAPGMHTSNESTSDVIATPLYGGSGVDSIPATSASCMWWAPLGCRRVYSPPSGVTVEGDAAGGSPGRRSDRPPGPIR